MLPGALRVNCLAPLAREPPPLLKPSVLSSDSSPGPYWLVQFISYCFLPTSPLQPKRVLAGPQTHAILPTCLPLLTCDVIAS